MGAMIEADGHYWISAQLGPRNVTPSVHVGVTNTDPEVMSACLRVTGAGKVRPHDSGLSKLTSTKPCFRWYVQAWLDTLGLLQRIRPYSMKAQTALTKIGALYGAPV